MDCCQCCLSTDARMTDMLSGDYYRKITYCFSLETIDRLEGFICVACVNKLEDCLVFRRQIESSQSKLREALKNADRSSDTDYVSFGVEYLDEETDFAANVDSNFENELKDESGSIKNVEYLREHYEDANFRENDDDLLNFDSNVTAKNGPSVRRRNKSGKPNCAICKRSFSDREDLETHMNSHPAKYVCDLCGKSFKMRNYFATHKLRYHKIDVTVVCQVCSKSMKKSSLARHMRIHSGDTLVYACTHCDERFASFTARDSHLRESHDVDICRHSCMICSKKFHLSSILKLHVRRCHFQELNATCEECGKGFFDKKSLKDHMTKHTGERNHKCEICCKSFARKYTLKIHMKLHNVNDVS